MQKNRLILLLSVFMNASLSMNAQTPDYYFTNFNSGIPSGFKVLDLDECEIDEDYYRNVDFAIGWSVNRIDMISNYAAMSLSRTSERGVQQSNWLITPKIAITSENAFIRWDARSLLKSFPEKYRVMISTTDSKSASFSETASFDAEESEWNTRVLSLAEYKNQEIYVAFVCESTDKYILAIDNLTIGELNDEKIIVTDDTPRYCGDEGTILASGIIYNAGIEQDWISLIAKTSNGEEEFQIDKFPTNSELSFNFNVPVNIGVQSKYTLSAKKSDGTLMELLSDSIICSYFKRNLLVDKTTGTWCNNCPEGEVYMKPIKKRYKGSLITINSHCNDPMACTEYFAGLNQWIFNLPTTIVNRDRKTINNISYGNYDYSKFNDILTTETIVQVTATAMMSEDCQSVEINSIVEFANDLDNSQDNYKLGYAIIENTVYQPEHYGYKQQNNSSMPRVGEYYLMPTYIPQDIIVYEDVVREGSTAFSGKDYSLPAEINRYEKINVSQKLSIPNSVIDKSNLDIVVFVINRDTDIVMNAVRIPCKEFNSIKNANATLTGVPDLKIRNDSMCEVSFSDLNNQFVFEVYSADGRLLKQIKDNASKNVEIDLSNYKGFIIVKATQNGVSAIRKAVVK